VTNHLRLDLDLVELLAGVDANDATDHLGNDDHVSEVSLDNIGLLVGLGLLLGLAELLDETHRTALQATVDATTLAGWEDASEVLAGHIEELVKVDSTVRELSERSLSLELGSLLGIVFVSHDRGVGLIEFAGRESEYGWAGMESTLKSVVESLRWARFKFWVGFSCPSPLVT
jgi:hypothetical protein